MASEEIMKLLKFGSKEHAALNDKLRGRLKLSKDKFSDAHAQMARNEEQFRAYIPEKEADKVRRNARKQGMPQYTTIEVPYSYAQILATHTYITSVFLSRDPVLQYAGRHGESQQQEQCVEALMAYQLQQALVEMYIWLLDPGKYGYGVIGHYWCEEKVRVRERVEEPVTLMGVPVPGMKPKLVDKVREIPGFVGNKLYNVRPQDWFPDPRVPISQFQRGEFCARYVELTWAELHEGRRQKKYFNLEVLRQMEKTNPGGEQGDLMRDTGSDAVSNLPNSDFEANTWGESDGGKNTFVVKAFEVYVRLIPRLWGLGKEEEEEIWIFTRSSSGVVIGAQPLPNWHGKFGFDVIEDEVDGYNLFSKSSLEMMKPLNDVMSWLVNTHFYNVRASLNNQFIVDPSMLVMKDVENPDPGKLLRLKPTAYGRDVRTVISQLPVQDITRGHIGDMNLVAEMIQRATGVNDNIMGLVNQGGRKTASEVRTSSSFGVNRLKTKAEYYSAMGFGPLSQKLLQNSQQFYSIERKYRLVGTLAEFAPDFVEVTPESIAGFYDFVPVDGTLPVDRFAQANLWSTLLGQMRNFPQVMATYDMSKIFGFVAGLGGIKNISQFKLQVVPDARLMQQAQAGNSIPMEPKGNLNEPGQIPGMGATG
jgi:hypothetical protein